MRTPSATRTSPPTTPTGPSPIARTVKPGARFAAELGGMCAVMCASGIVLSLAAFAVADWLGYGNLARQAPELSALIITVFLAAPMAAYMAVRRHPLRHNLLMTGSTVAVGLVVIGLLWSGTIAASSIHGWHSLFSLICGPACLLMIGEMLLSFRMYSGQAEH
jgi:hypothetical protein